MRDCEPTCDLPHGAKHVELLRVQGFNLVIDVPVGGWREQTRGRQNILNDSNREVGSNDHLRIWARQAIGKGLEGSVSKYLEVI